MWTKDVKPGRDLEHLGLITARLARIVLYQKIARGEAQLRAAGIDAKLLTAFRAAALKEVRLKRKPVRVSPDVVFTSRGKMDF